MTILISVHNSSGCVGRCDARCYDAKSGPCSCICGGANHGAGVDQATVSTKKLAETWIDAYEEKNGYDFEFKVNQDHKQLSFLKGA